MIQEYEVEVHQYTTVRVKVDTAQFTPEFLQEFRDQMYPFAKVDEHIMHLAQLYARRLIRYDQFIEGYGDPSMFQVEFVTLSEGQEEEILAYPEDLKPGVDE